MDDLQERIAWSKANPEKYCCFESAGRIEFDPGKGTKHYDPWWMLLICDRQIQEYYAWFLKKWGKPVWIPSLWGSHISVIKHEEPPDKFLWGKINQEVKFRYTNNVRWDNGKHAWLDVYSPHLSLIRTNMGLPAKEWFHLTIGIVV